MGVVRSRRKDLTRPAQEAGLLFWETGMKIIHHDLEVELNDEWWEAAGMNLFIPKTRAYLTHQVFCENQPLFEVPIEDVGPVRRAPGVGIFNESEEGTSARDRVVSILSGFRSNVPIPPVQIVTRQAGYPYPYKLVAGAHRLYCSLAAGFTYIPAIKGFDWAR